MKRLSLREIQWLIQVTEPATSGAAILFCLIFICKQGHHISLNTSICCAEMGKGAGRDEFGKGQKEIK